MRKVWRENGLSIVLFALFAVLLAGQSYVGLLRENDELLEHAQSPISWTEYVTSGGFLEATMENWESEFLQMWAYVIFTVFLFQKGSSESKPPDQDHPVNRDPRAAKDKRTAPWPVRAGGLPLRLYEISLSTAFFLLFAFSFTLHAVGGARDYNEIRALHGEPLVTTLEYLAGSQFWLSRCRTGRANSSLSGRWWCSASICGSAARPSRNRSMRRTPRPVPSRRESTSPEKRSPLLDPLF